MGAHTQSPVASSLTHASPAFGQWALQLGQGESSQFTSGLGTHETPPEKLLLTLPNYAAWMRFLIDDTRSEATFVEMLPPPKAINHRPHRLITNSRVRFGRDRATVEERIARFLAQ